MADSRRNSAPSTRPFRPVGMRAAPGSSPAARRSAPIQAPATPHAGT